MVVSMLCWLMMVILSTPLAGMVAAAIRLTMFSNAAHVCGLTDG